MRGKFLLSLIAVFALIAGGFALNAQAQESSNFVDPQFREELSADLDGLDDELATLREITEQKLSQPAKFARACLLYALEWIREENAIGDDVVVASSVKAAAEIALFMLKGHQIATHVFANKCLDLQDPDGNKSDFVGKGAEESPHFDIKGIEDIKIDIEVLFKEDIVTRVDEAIRTGLIKGEELITEIQTELNAMFLKLFELNDKLIEADIFINSCVNQLLAAIAAVEKELKTGSGVAPAKTEPNFRKAASAIKRCIRDLNRLIRIEKSIFLEVKEFVLEKVLFIKKLFFLVPLPVPGPTPPPIGLSLNSGALSVQVFDLQGRLVFDSAASGSLSWNHVGANGVYFYVVTGRAADGRLTRSVQKLVVLN